MKILALDVGDRRIGAALSDPLGITARGVAVWTRRSLQTDCETIAQWVREHHVEKIIIGHPLNADGTAGPQAEKTERFAQALAEKLNALGIQIPIELWDEYGSTQTAQSTMLAAGRSRRERRDRLDAVAAAAILQDYLEAKGTDHA